LAKPADSNPELGDPKIHDRAGFFGHLRAWLVRAPLLLRNDGVVAQLF